MSKICQITKKRPIVGNTISHANNKNKRRFYVNLSIKRFFIPEQGKWIKLKVSAAGIKTINKLGIETILKRIKYKK